MDMYEDPANTRIVAVLELPGLTQDDVAVRIEDDRLVVQGERRFRHLARLSASPASVPVPHGEHHSAPAPAPRPEAEASSLALTLPRGYAVQEIKYGTFRRSIALPAGTQVSIFFRDHRVVQRC